MTRPKGRNKVTAQEGWLDYQELAISEKSLKLHFGFLTEAQVDPLASTSQAL